MPIKKEDYWIRPKKRMLEYQVRVFENELKKERKNYEKLLAGQEERAKQRGARFKSIEELNEAYIKGLVDEKDMGWQKIAIWNAYDDHDHPARIKWLEAEYAKYKRRLDYLIQYIDERREASRKKYWSYFRKYNKRGKYQQSIDKLPEEQRIRAEKRREERRKRQAKLREKRRYEKNKQLERREKMKKEILK